MSVLKLLRIENSLLDTQELRFKFWDSEIIFLDQCWSAFDRNNLILETWNLVGNKSKQPKPQGRPKNNVSMHIWAEISKRKPTELIVNHEHRVVCLQDPQ